MYITYRNLEELDKLTNDCEFKEPKKLIAF